MKKTLAATITSALVIGAFSTTFAAANPFSDVPTDHWAFDAVAKLAQEGVIEGYGDDTFRGDAHITRYEMAQMVAKAMSKDLNGADKAAVDKLAAEFADELNNLGVRVTNLEKKSDNVKFEGLLRLNGSSHEVDYDNGTAKDHSVTGMLRLDMTAFVNDDWTAKARLEGSTDLDNGDSAIGDEKFEAVRIYAEGPLFGATAKLGKIELFDNRNLTNGGLIADTQISGGEFIWDGGALTTTLTAGRIDSDDYNWSNTVSLLTDETTTTDYAAVNFGYAATDRLNLAAGYYNLKNNYRDAGLFLDGNTLDDTNSIWSLGFDYDFSDKVTFGALYAGSSADAGDAIDSDEENAYSFQLTYGGAQSDQPNSYGLWLAYRQVGALASIKQTFDGAGWGEKGVEFGMDYMLDKNILLKGVYFNGEEITGGADVEKIFGRVEFQF